MPLVSTVLSDKLHAALQKAPGKTDGQKLRWLCAFFEATISEKEVREANEKEAAAKAERAKLHAVKDSVWNGEQGPEIRGKFDNGSFRQATPEEISAEDAAPKKNMVVTGINGGAITIAAADEPERFRGKVNIEPDVAGAR